MTHGKRCRSSGGSAAEREAEERPEVKKKKSQTKATKATKVDTKANQDVLSGIGANKAKMDAAKTSTKRTEKSQKASVGEASEGVEKGLPKSKSMEPKSKPTVSDSDDSDEDDTSSLAAELAQFNEIREQHFIHYGYYKKPSD